MQFLKTLLWVIAAVLLALFMFANWSTVVVRLGDISLWTKLGPLVIAAFLIGFLPIYMFHRAHIWRLRRRVAALELRVADLTAPPEPAPVPNPAPPPEPMPLQVP